MTVIVFIYSAKSQWDQLVEDLIEFLEYEAPRFNRTWSDVTQFMILQVQVKTFFDKLNEFDGIECFI